MFCRTPSRGLRSCVGSVIRVTIVYHVLPMFFFPTQILLPFSVSSFTLLVVFFGLTFFHSCIRGLCPPCLPRVLAPL